MRCVLLILAILCSVLAASSGAAQSIRGTVIDDETGDSITGVLVEARTARGRTVASAQTNVTGEFLLHVGRTGMITLHLTHIAYRNIDTDTLVVRADEALQVSLRMGRTTIPLEPLVVTTRSSGPLEGFYERMRRPGPGRFVTRAYIDSRPGAEATDLLRELPGVEIVPIAPPAVQGDRQGGQIGPKMNNNIYLRGGAGRCVPTIFIDGMMVRQMDHLSSIDDLIRPGMLEGAEVHIGTNVPSPLYTHGNCGVVAFWSRRGDGGTPFRWSRLVLGAAGFVGAIALGGLLAR